MQSIINQTLLLNRIPLSNVSVLRYAVIGIFLFVLFRLLHIYLLRFARKRRYKRLLNRAIPIVELLTWILFCAWGVEYFLSRNYLFAFGIFVLLLFGGYWISRFILKETIAGFIFRGSNHLQVNETVYIDNYSGRIVKLRINNVELETDNGERVFIPYSTFFSSIHRKKHQSDILSNYSFRLQTDNDVPFSEKAEQIRTAIIQLPWTSVKHTPRIKLIADKQDTYLFEITVYSFEEMYFNNIEQRMNILFDATLNKKQLN